MSFSLPYKINKTKNKKLLIILSLIFSILFLILLYRCLDLQEKHAEKDNPEETCQKET